MSVVRSSAPGKAVILGEYAVLEGAPALVMAVNRRVRVSLEQRDSYYCSLESPGWNETPADFRLDPTGLVSFDEPADAFALAAGVISGFFSLRNEEASCAPFRLVLDSRDLITPGPDGRVKLGLGSSAALTVALCHALSYYAASHQGPARTPDLGDLIRIHAGLQGHRGSGLDVAASLHGGLIEYRRRPPPWVTRCVLPEGLNYCFVWSGHGTDTAAFLAAVDKWRDQRRQAHQRMMAALVNTAELGLRALHGNDGEGLVRVLDDYVFLLQELGNACGIDILSEPHRRLRELAREHGVVYKPCGAGGGDIGIGIAADPEALAGFKSGVFATDYQLLQLRRDDLGVHTQWED